MATHSRDESTGDTEFGDAVAQLQESMDGLSKDMSGLEAATRKLETSTRNLSETQLEISEQMSRAAEGIRSVTRSKARIDGSSTAAAADD